MFCFVECVRNYFFFRKARCCFATMFVLVSFSSFCFFWKEVFVIGISRVSVWPFGFGIIYFSGRRVVVLRRVCVGFVFLLLFFFLRDVFVIGLSRVSVWSFWVWNYLVFGRRGVVLRRVFVAFVFLLLFFWKGMFVIGISRVSVWSNGLGRKSKFCCATPFCCFCFVMFVLKNC